MHSYVAHTSFSERHNRAQPLIPADGPLVYRQSDFLFSDHILPRQQNLWVVSGSGSRPSV